MNNMGVLMQHRTEHVQCYLKGIFEAGGSFLIVTVPLESDFILFNKEKAERELTSGHGIRVLSLL